MPMPEYSEHHVWVIATLYDATAKQARRAFLRHSVHVEKGERLDALDVYCKQCRRTWDDVADELCVAAQGNEHLRGGPIGERKKRKAHSFHDCLSVGCPGVNGEYLEQVREKRGDDPDLPLTG